MKKIFTILLISFLAINTSFAQFGRGGGFGQGTIILGATTELAPALHHDEVPWSLVAMKPSIGYFISDKFVLGVGFDLDHDTNEEEEGSSPDEYTETNTISTITIGPWMRFYVGDMFFINAGVAFGIGNETDKTSDKNLSGWTDSDGDLVSKMTDKSSTFDLEIGAGASIFWGDHLVFEPMFGLEMGGGSKTDFDQDTEKLESTIHLGFRIGVCLMLNN